ncbi:MAG: Dabb family protein [Verrucomicrobia bacterium]|nr:Dabb family protein [Verrucomicrobiota bacterium]
MLVHTVVFWLRKDLSPAAREAFRREGLGSLSTISSVSTMHIGAPAPIPPRPVVDASYDFAITALFADVAAHDAYQIDPAHKAFLARFKGDWERVQIYDAL